MDIHVLNCSAEKLFKISGRSLAFFSLDDNFVPCDLGESVRGRPFYLVPILRSVVPVFFCDKPFLDGGDEEQDLAINPRRVLECEDLLINPFILY